MNGACLSQAFRFPDGHLGSPAGSAGGHRRANHGAVLGCVAENLPADDDEHPEALGVGAGEVGNAVQVPT